MFVFLGNSHLKFGGCNLRPISSSKSCNFSLPKIAKRTYTMKEHIEDSIPERYLSWKVVSRKFSEYLVLKFPPRQKLSFSQINLQIVCKIEIQLSFLMVLFAVKFFIFMVFCQLDEEISQYITIVVTNENFVRKEKFRKNASCIRRT